MSPYRCPPPRPRASPPQRIARLLLRPTLALLIALLIALGSAPLALLGPAATASAQSGVGSLAVRVYQDVDRDGTDDAGSDPGLGNFAVTVYSADDLPRFVLNTDSAPPNVGLASFGSVPYGDYRVEITPPAGSNYAVSVPGATFTNPGLVFRVRVDADNPNPFLRVGMRALNDSNLDPEVAGGRAITTRVWDDRDADGVQDADEPGIPGLTVQLSDSTGTITRTAVAGPDGLYAFNDAPTGGGYRVRVLNPPPGYTLTRPDADPRTGGDARDSDAALADGFASVPLSLRGANLDTVDIGFARGAIGGFIFRDVDADGAFDVGLDARLNGVLVELLDSSDTVITSTRTRLQSGVGAVGGVYSFGGLEPGRYTVRVPGDEFVAGRPLFGAANSPGTAGDDRATPDGVVSTTAGVTIPVTLDFLDIPGGSNRDAEAGFGFYQGSIGDFVWYDLDRDGVQDPDELGQNGVLVFIDANANGVRDPGELSTTTATSPDGLSLGYYRFDNLPLGGAYTVTLAPENFLPGEVLEGVAVHTSTATLTTNALAQTYYFTRSAELDPDSPADLGVDFALNLLDLGNRVFVDANGNGRFDLGEAGVPGVTVELRRAATDSVVTTTLTGATGVYTIPNLPSRGYYAVFDLAGADPAFDGYVGSISPLTATVDPAETTLIDYTDLITPALSATSWRTDVFTPTPGIANTGVDAGFYALTTLSGRAFFDTDGDDLDAADPDAEPGMRAVEVRLLRAADSAVVTTTLTSATGAYALADVAPGDYLLEFVNPVTATFELITGTTAVTTTSPLASDVEAVSPAGAGRTGTISVTSGESLDEIDAGFRGLGDVAGRVFLDADGSNTQTALDSSLAGATAALTVTADLPNLAAIYSAVVSPTNTVAGDPNYSFAGLPLGAGVTYTLAISPPATLPAERPYLSSDPDVGDDALDSDGPVIVVTDPTTASLDFDQGFFQEARITARVFEELVGAPDNSFAAGDEGIGGATVRLEAITGTLALSETTVDATGLVTFTARPGSYRLRLDESTLPAGLQPSPGYSNPITLTENPLLSGEDSNTDGAGNNSFGFFRTGTISGTVFFDRDLDQRRAGEPGVGGVEVTLDDGTTAVTTTTSASGVYSFTGLVSGTYSLSFANPGPGNLAFVTGGDSLVDANGAIASVTVGRGADVGGQDAGLVGRSSVGGLAFVDADADGRSDGPPDRGLPGVTVTLTMDVTLPGLTTQITRTAVTTATTGISGTYSFAGLPGDPDGAGGDSTAAYTLTFTAPVATPPWQVTDPDQGDDDGDSDGAAQLRSQTLAPATTDERDQGYFQDVTITARVFEERAGAADNSFAAGDLGLAGVAVGLEQIGGTPTVTPTQTTGETGLVTFTVRPGSYRLRLDEAAVPEGLNPSPGWANPVTITTALGDGLILSGESSLAGEPAGANSFGYFRTGTISGTVFFDRDLDGLKSAEPGLANVEVALRLGASVVDTTTTSPTGAYTFTDVVSGSYTLVFTNPDPGNFAFFTGGDSDLATAGAIATSTIDLGPVPFGASRGDNDAGLRGLAAVGGLAFEDADADGRSDGPDDRPLAGVTVTLTLDVGLPDLATQITRTATTTATGVYSFTGLPGGGTSAYTLTFQAPDGTWLLTDPDQGDDDGDSDGAAQLADQPLAPGQQVARDQGYFQNVTITARVFDELVAVNNSFEAGEAGIAGVDISLDTAPPDSETTGLTGVVTFTVRPGSYTLTSATPAGFTPSPANTGTLAMTATSGLKLTADFGYFRAGSLAGTAWFDSSRDGRLDAGEPGMEGVTVTLQASGGGPDLGQGVTDATGAYAITGILPSGVGAAPAGYRLCFAATADFTPTVRAGATGDDDTNDANPDGCTDAFTMEGSGASLTTVDAGFLGLNRIGDLVWNDLDGDGVQDAGESGIAGAVVTLAISTTGTINSGDPTVVMTATSTASADLGANYAVTGAPPAAGFRVVGVTPPAGFALGPTNVLTATEATDSDAVGDSFGAVPPDNLDVDFGLVSLTTVGDLAWLDVNGNGRLDAGEPGVPGVGVELLRGGAVISATTTAAGAQAGRYAFADLAPGTYSLRFVPQAGYVFTNDGAGAIATDGDNDARADGTTTEFTLTGGQQLLSVDAGLRGTGAIGGLVWVDTNRNNVRDPAETGRLEGVRVTLTLTPTFAAQPLVRATATAADGGYSFADLPEGRATVSFAQPTGFFPVAPNVGPEATDSDGPVARLDLAPGGQVANVDMGYREQGLFVYLPVVQGRVERAELVGSVSVTRASNVAYTPVQIAVTVTNRGDGPASNFWVDLYINPSRRPAVNDRWNDICGTTATPCQGLAWFYTGTLAPGQSVSLVSTATSDTSPTGFVRAASTWSGTFFNGTSVLYALVDSWNRDETGAVRDPEGAVREQDETNNLTEQAVVVTPGTPPIELQAAPGAAPLDRATLRR